MKKNISLLLAAPLLLALSSCSYKMVKKPAINPVKKLAIVSVYSNRGLYNLSGGGGLGEGLSMLGSMIGKKSDKEEKTALRQDFGGTRLVEHAHQQYAQALGQVPGWQVVPFTNLKEDQNYRSFVEKKQADLQVLGKGIAKLHETQFTVVPEMTWFDLGNRLEKNQQVLELAELCGKLNVDAVIVIKMDFGYESHMGVGKIGGGMTGSATASVATDLAAVTRDGRFGILSQPVKRGSGQRFKSSGKTVMVVGNVPFDEKTEKMFQEATSNNVADYKQKINQQL